METRKISFQLNGAEKTLEVRPDESLMGGPSRALRPHLAEERLRAQGQCGCCTVMLDGKAVVSCVIDPAKAEGKEVGRLEGLPRAGAHIFKEAFVWTAGLQCGFCIPGIVMRAHWLLEKTPKPSRDEIESSWGPHLCRCTGYVKIIDAIELAATAFAARRPPHDWSGKIGTSLPKFEGGDLALGDAATSTTSRCRGCSSGRCGFPTTRGRA